MGYKRDAIIGISWIGLLKVTTRSLSLVKILILARFFTPKEFGLYGIASLLLSLLEILAETGINVILIQENNFKRYLNTAWIVSILRGVVVSLMILVLTPFIVKFFNAPDSFNLLLLMSLVPLIRGFINPAIVLYQKELHFKNEFYLRFFISLVETVAVIFISLSTHSIASIVLGLIIGALLEVALSFIVIKVRPVFQFEKGTIREVISRGKWVTAAGIFNYFFHNIDDIFVGRLLNASSLGLYQMAYRISIFPITEISDVVSKVTFPVYVKIAFDKYRLRKAFLKMLSLIGLLSIMFGIVIIGFTKEVVLLVLGEKWLEIVPFLKILTIFGVIRGVSGSTSALFLAVKKQKYVSIVTFISFIAIAALAIPFIYWGGLIGASFSSLVAALVALPAIIYFTYKVLYV